MNTKLDELIEKREGIISDRFSDTYIGMHARNYLIQDLKSLKETISTDKEEDMTVPEGNHAAKGPTMPQKTFYYSGNIDGKMGLIRGEGGTGVERIRKDDINHVAIPMTEGEVAKWIVEFCIKYGYSFSIVYSECCGEIELEITDFPDTIYYNKKGGLSYYVPEQIREKLSLKKRS